jgi:hypothetical protein
MVLPFKVNNPNLTTALRVFTGLGALLGALAVWNFEQLAGAEGLLLTSVNFQLAVYGGYAVVALLASFAIVAWTPLAKKALKLGANLQAAIFKLGPLRQIIVVLLAVIYPYLLFGFYGQFLTNAFTRFFILAVFSVIAASLVTNKARPNWFANFAASALGFAFVYIAAAFFSQVTDALFSLEWSEISRYYQASFFFDQRIYGMDLPLPVTHPSRYMLQSLPFLLPVSPLWLHRFWQALLWVGMPLLAGWALVRRLPIKSTFWRWTFIVWVALFLLQGAVFYHLLPCVILVLIGFDKQHPWRAFAFVALASIWAGLSRINWAPVPGTLAAMLYVLETAPSRKVPVLSLSYLWQPLLYGIGGSLIALGAYWIYIVNSGNPVDQFSSSFTSALLWDRLWPNSAFPLGILPGILLVSLPLVAAIWLRVSRKGEGLDLWRALGIAAVLVIFFAGGLVVSVKIGGGTNLHNMDAYMVLLLVLAAGVVSGAYAILATKNPKPMTVPASLIAAAVAIPVWFAISVGQPLQVPTRQDAETVRAQIQVLANQALENGTQVLFISQRHLLTFNQIDNVPLIFEYEKLFLMEMAISGNDAYLSEFQKEIDQQRFGLIVTDPLYNNIVDETQDTLAAENNAWVRHVSRTILCAYEPVATYSNPPVQLLVPRYGDKCD